MRKVLIIGSKGMLGQELVRVFKVDKDYKVIAWDKEDIDISKEKEVSKKVSFTKPNIIINAAAYNAVDKCEESEKPARNASRSDAGGEFELAKKINGLAPGYLAKAAKKNKATLIHYSTDYVFNGQPASTRGNDHSSTRGGPDIPEPAGCSGSCANCSLHEKFQPVIGFDEEAQPDPINNYGRSKLMGEEEVQENLKKYYIIRTSKIFGQPAKSEEAKKSFFDVMLELGKKNKELKAVDEETSCFTYAPDLAKKTKEIIDSEKTFGIYHVVNGDPCTWYEATLELYKQAKLKTKVLPVEGGEFPRPAERPFYSVLLNTKLNPMRSYKKALKDYLKNK